MSARYVSCTCLRLPGIAARPGGTHLPGSVGGTAGSCARRAAAPARRPLGGSRGRLRPSLPRRRAHLRTAAPTGRTLTAAELVPEGGGGGGSRGGGGGGGSAAGGGRRAAVPALVSELAAALLEGQARSLPDGRHQLRLLLAQVLLPAAQRRTGAARLLRPAGGGDAQPPAEAAPRQRRTPADTRGRAPRSPPAPARLLTSRCRRRRRGRGRAAAPPAAGTVRGGARAPWPPHRAPPRRRCSPPAPPGSRDRRGWSPVTTPYSSLSFLGERGQLSGEARAVGGPSRGGRVGGERGRRTRISST